MADYTLMFLPQKILSLLGLLGQNIMLLCHYTEQKRIIENRLAILCILLVVFGFSFYCLFCIHIVASEKCGEKVTVHPRGQCKSASSAYG